MEQEKLKKQLKRIPKLEQKIVDLEKEKQRWIAQQSGIKHSLKKADLPKQQIGTLAYYQETLQTTVQNQQPENKIKKPSKAKGF